MTCTANLRRQSADGDPAAERRKLAETLHDGALQDLAAINIKLAALELEPPASAGELRERLHELKDLTEAAIGDLNRTIRMLSGIEKTPDPSSSAGEAGGGLVARLRELVEAFRADSDIACRFSVSPDHLKFDPVVCDVLYRAVGELLTNVEKHAQASRVEVETALRPDGAVVLRVADDGVGLPELTWPNLPFDGGGFGLWSIEHRLSELGAFMEIEGDNGLCARIVLPAALVRKAD